MQTTSADRRGRRSGHARARVLPGAKRARAGFTLVEVLVAMLFMAIVVPVAIAGLRVAGRAGEVGLRKTVATRIAERVLNEMIVTGQAQKNAQSGHVEQNNVGYDWSLNMQSSGLETLRLATVQVTFPVQGQNYDVRLSTLVDTTQ